MKKTALLFLAFGLCVSCQSSLRAEDFDDVPNGAHKGLVLDKLGSPNRTFRKDDADHWVYVFKGSNNQPVEQEVLFKEGKVVGKKIRGKPKDSDYVPVN